MIWGEGHETFDRSAGRLCRRLRLLVGVVASLLGLTTASRPSRPARPVRSSFCRRYNSQPPPDLLDGTLSGIGDEEENDEPELSFLRFPSPLQPWLDFKQGVQQEYGFSIGGSEGMLGQLYSNSLTDNHNAVGQKFTLNVGQQILFRGTPECHDG